jgi:hypothetical protein
MRNYEAKNERVKAECATNRWRSTILSLRLRMVTFSRQQSGARRGYIWLARLEDGDYYIASILFPPSYFPTAESLLHALLPTTTDPLDIRAFPSPKLWVSHDHLCLSSITSNEPTKPRAFLFECQYQRCPELQSFSAFKPNHSSLSDKPETTRRGLRLL